MGVKVNVTDEAVDMGSLIVGFASKNVEREEVINDFKYWSFTYTATEEGLLGLRLEFELVE